MTITAPRVYIGGAPMDTAAAGNRPVLSGLKISWGTEEAFELDPPATATCQILLKNPAAYPFNYAKGSTFIVLDAGTDRTIFAGRIATLHAAQDDQIKTALRITLTAADFLADLVQYRRNVYWPDLTGPGTRMSQLAAIMPAGWTLDGGHGYIDGVARRQRWTGKEWLDMADLHCRATLTRRHHTTTYTPAGGLARRVTFSAERGKTGPLTGNPIITLSATNLAGDLEWEKNPDSVVTDVKLTSVGLATHWDSQTGTQVDDDESGEFDIWEEAYAGVPNTAALQAAHGVHSITVEADFLPSGVDSPHVATLISHWLETDQAWRLTAVKIADSRLLADSTVLNILDATKRGMLYTIVDDLPPATPALTKRVEAYAVAGEAAWNGKKSRWEITLTLGRQTAASGTPVEL